MNWHAAHSAHRRRTRPDTLGEVFETCLLICAAFGMFIYACLQMAGIGVSP